MQLSLFRPNIFGPKSNFKILTRPFLSNFKANSSLERLLHIRSPVGARKALFGVFLFITLKKATMIVNRFQRRPSVIKTSMHSHNTLPEKKLSPDSSSSSTENWKALKDALYIYFDQWFVVRYE